MVSHFMESSCKKFFVFGLLGYACNEEDMTVPKIVGMFQFGYGVINVSTDLYLKCISWNRPLNSPPYHIEITTLYGVFLISYITLNSPNFRQTVFQTPMGNVCSYARRAKF